MDNESMTSGAGIDARARKAQQAAREMAALSTESKNAALSRIADALWSQRERIFAANRDDLDRAERDGLAAPLAKRLRFQEKKLRAVIDGIHKTIELDDPVGHIRSARELDAGLRLYQVSTPIGVLGIIFESRPDALVQISTLALKSGNAVLLKGGSEAAATNRILADVITGAGIPADSIQLVETRREVGEMLALDRYIDLIIPRGSNEFVRHIMDNTRVPVLGHADGVCHLYLDESADPDMAERVVLDSKTQYVAVCNAVETLLVHRREAEAILPRLLRSLENAGVTVKGCERSRELVARSAPENGSKNGGPGISAATEEDWATEYLDMVVSLRIVDDLDQAVEHINTYGSHHTDGIVTSDAERASVFMDRVDSASVMWNASTRFADGYRYGLGAEIGISTSKIHARGPVGLEGVVTYKWRLEGDGHIVADYTGDGARRFTHRPL